MTVQVSLFIPIRNCAARDQAIPDEQYDQRADGSGDEPRALVGAVMAHGLSDPGGEKRSGDAEYRGQDETRRIVRPRRQHARDDPGDEADDDDPENAAHGEFLSNDRRQSRPEISLALGSRPSGVK